MKCLLLGAGGRLGRELEKALTARYDVRALGHAEADIADEAAISQLVERERPDVIVNAAAWTDVTGAQTHEKEAYAANALGVENLARAAKRFDTALLHYSTDYVFSGEGDSPWRENDATAPLGVYGASKLAGERAFLLSGARGAIVRVGWLHSGERDFIAAILARALKGGTLSVVDNQWGTPSAADALARWTVSSMPGLLSTDGVRVVHYVETGDYISRYQMADYLLRRAEAHFEKRGDTQGAVLCRRAVETMTRVTLMDGIRPANCRLAPTDAPDLASTKAWQEGVDKSVEKMISAFLPLWTSAS